MGKTGNKRTEIRLNFIGFTLLTAFLVLISCILSFALVGKLYPNGMFGRPRNSAADSRRIRDNLPRSEGIWGELVFSDIMLSPPEEFIGFDSNPQIYPNAETTWVFAGASTQDAQQTMESCGLSSDQVQAALKEESYTNGNTVIRPDDNLIFSLSPRARAALYGKLAEFDGNTYMASPFVFPRNGFHHSFADTDLDPRVLDALNKLLYNWGDSQVFSDYQTVLRMCPTTTERVELTQALNRRPVVLPGLHVRPTDNIDDLAKYWSVGSDWLNVRTLLKSIQDVPGGGYLSVTYLMPKLARQRLYTFPMPAGRDANQDCQWTAFNFFSDQPDDGYYRENYILSQLNTRYHLVDHPSQLGDVITFWRQNGPNSSQWYHSCVYIAGDIVFSKNGANKDMPWEFMHLADTRAQYSRGGIEPIVRVYRDNRFDGAMARN